VLSDDRLVQFCRRQYVRQTKTFMWGDTERQWRRYTRAQQVKWPGWKIHRPDSSPGSALPSPAYCFASVIVWTENKTVTISDRFICFILTAKRHWRPVFWGRQLKKVVNFFQEKMHPVIWPSSVKVPTFKWPNWTVGNVGQSTVFYIGLHRLPRKSIKAI